MPRPVRRRAHSVWDDLPIVPAPTTDLPTFAELGLPGPVVVALRQSGIETPFPIQAATIPSAIRGRDVLGRAATGSGKTLAFGLPLIARLSGGTSAARRPRGLVLVPTRELAMQVNDTLAPVAQAVGLTVGLVAGGLPIGKQIAQLQRGIDIVIATPGRLKDLINRRACALSAVDIVVLDEADHMADLGFLPAVRELLDLTPSDGQRLLFSATLDGDVATLVDAYLHDPDAYALSSATSPAENIEHYLFRISRDAKSDVVAQIAAREGRTILFVRTKHGADRLAGNLAKAGVAAVALHGGRTQAQRNRALESFRDGRTNALVATDVAARGIHVDDVSLVLHVDPPQDAKDYLHRSGRTARAGNSGVVVVLATPQEERAVRQMLTSADVRAEHREIETGDATLAAVTGARTPTGKPIIDRPRQNDSHAARRPGEGRRSRPRQGSPSRSTPRRGESGRRRASEHGRGHRRTAPARSGR